MKNIIERNHITVVGTGKETIVLGHGFGCDQNVWRYIIPYLEKDYRLVLFDYVGSGKSDKSQYNIERYRNLDGYAQDLIEILDCFEIRDAIFIGHSVSSMIGILSSIHNSKYFKKMVLIGPSPRYINDEPDYYGGFNHQDINEILTFMEMNFLGWASANAAALIDNPDKPDLVEQLENTFTSEEPGIMKYFARATFLSDYRKELQLVTTPSLILQCSVDSIVPLEVAEYMKNNLQNSDLKILDSRGHYPHLSMPKQTAEYILDYIKGRE
ncbi:alpha/beta fold hydrolase [Konateibacter massiliensis]|uniref:alpha/beta fold hydrolase n=1 Tax=Konateibacter massiliensis TaxID=2002841 RepID=UPI000C14B95E|nr:alpha/beta hydrolase [Konateibacter massiliensis]